MQIAKVCGTVVSTQKLPTMTGVKLLLVQFVDREGELLPRYEVASDPVGAGLDEWVLVSRRAIAPHPEGPDVRPVDAIIVGIIDTVSVSNGLLYSKKDEYRYR
ncbi:EutN/CcmL family microcompartment protein [Spirulina subsalsa]|uniref:EutN/CcmL family microcompartment protein n=1 Tax=Spirulina subsalsa TaxID=54311 RepID=UPI000365C4FC|nr:EutN/CcmL family microcompartment protein [Spirulina subsalsa]